MRRRKFIGACGAAAAAGLAAPARAGENEEVALLTALAGTVIPDKQPGVWTAGPCSENLARAWGGLSERARAPYSAALRTLDSRAAESFGQGKSFASLAPADRTALVKKLLDEDSSFRGTFFRMRSLFVSAFYDTPLGHRRTGFRATNQFAGYPDLDQYPLERRAK